MAVLSLNIRWIADQSNFNKLKILLSCIDTKPDLISLSETWINPSISNYFDKVSGYRVVHNSRKVSKGGSVGFFINKGSHLP